jgi:tRNA modification GTPase
MVNDVIFILTRYLNNRMMTGSLRYFRVLLKNTSDTVERIGIERSVEKLRECEIAFLLFDSSSDPDSDDEQILSSVKSSDGIKIAILTKCDRRDSKIEEYRKLISSVGFDAILEISSEKDPEGAIAAVTDTLDKLLGAERVKLGEDAIVSSARQHASLMRAREYLCFALSAYEAGIPRDAAASDIELALGAISEIDGREVTEEIVTDIFSKFCVGK